MRCLTTKESIQLSVATYLIQFIPVIFIRARVSYVYIDGLSLRGLLYQIIGVLLGKRNRVYFPVIEPSSDTYTRNTSGAYSVP
jgi:hypothetical protein